MRSIAALLLCAVAPLATAARGDYATQWAVEPTRAEAGAHAVTLPAEVYRAVQRTDLRDLDVLDARGEPVPADVLPPMATRAPRRVPARWYTLPSPGTTADGGWNVVADLDASGRLLGLRSTRGALSSPGNGSLLLDASPLLRANAPRPTLVALDLRWNAGDGFDRAYRLEGSDDFETWQTLGRGRLVEARQDGRRLLRHRVPAHGSTPLARYLRLVPDDGDAPLPAVQGVELELTDLVAPATSWLRLEARGQGRSFEFDLPGRFPVRWVDLDAAGNDARRWRLQSRDGDGDWIDRVDGWVAFRVGARRSPPQALGQAVRDRHWRLVAQADGPPPALRLGYMPERLVFLAAGTGPYTVVAGSAVAQRAVGPVSAVVDAGPTPPPAQLGPATPRAGQAALERPSDWKTWSLWAVLGVGVLLVAGFALRLLREPPPTAD